MASPTGRLQLQRAALVRRAVAREERDRGQPERRQQLNNAAPRRVTNFNNAGALPGVATIHEDSCVPDHAATSGATSRHPGRCHAGSRLQRVLGRRAAWSTRSSTSPTTWRFRFDTSAGASWGFLNQPRPSGAARSTPSGHADHRRYRLRRAVPVVPRRAGRSSACATAAALPLSQTAVPGPDRASRRAVASVQTEPVEAGLRASCMYISGHIFTFELAPGGSAAGRRDCVDAAAPTSAPSPAVSGAGGR